MPGIAKNLELEEYFELRPVGEYIASINDKELIHEASEFDARKKHYRWTINGATVAYYEAVLTEWVKRHPSVPIPKVSIKKMEISNIFREE